MKPFAFVVMADSHIRLDESESQAYFPSDQFANARNRYVVQKINQLAPEWVIHLGDIVYPIPALPAHETAVQIARDLYQRLESRLYVAPGNHDVGDKPNAWVPAPGVDEKSHEVFERYWGRSYLSFEHQDCHFVLLNSPVLNSGLQREKDQREWLEQDLAASREAGKRIFLFMHYALYLNHPHEAEHYDNIAEPARSWLLSLVEKHSVEAVFAGHAHCFFYNRYFDTDLYVLPSVTFVRPEFSELFHISPALEYGRNDAGKFGFFVVRVNQKGHSIEPIRTWGLTREQDETVVTRPLALSGRQAEGGASPVGVSLRHAWAQSIDMPYGNLDEFTRKPVRNDYVLLALWELGIRKLRVPLGDLANDRTRERMRALRTQGVEFTVFSTGAPSRHARETIARYHDLVAAWEVIAPWDQMPDVIPGIREAKQRAAVRTYLSKMDTLADQRQGQEFQFSHFASHGFRLEERDLLSTCVTDLGAAGVIDGFVFRLTPNRSPWQDMRSAGQMAADLNVVAMVDAQLPRGEEGVAFVGDLEISNWIAETVAAALAARGVKVFLDTFVDHDRGYYPRNGLLDRRYNPRASYYVFRHLQRALGDGHEIEMRPIDASAGLRAFAVQTSSHGCVLLLSDKQASHGQLDLSLPAGAGVDGEGAKWMNLRTGKVTTVQWKLSPLAGGQMALDLPPARFDPALLIFQE